MFGDRGDMLAVGAHCSNLIILFVGPGFISTKVFGFDGRETLVISGSRYVTQERLSCGVTDILSRQIGLRSNDVVTVEAFGKKPQHPNALVAQFAGMSQSEVPPFANARVETRWLPVLTDL